VRPCLIHGQPQGLAPAAVGVPPEAQDRQRGVGGERVASREVASASDVLLQQVTQLGARVQRGEARLGGGALFSGHGVLEWSLIGRALCSIHARGESKARCRSAAEECRCFRQRRGPRTKPPGRLFLSGVLQYFIISR